MAKASTGTGSSRPKTRRPRAGETASADRASRRASADAADTGTLAGPTVDTLVAQVGERLKEAGIDPERVLTAARDQAGEVQDKVVAEVKTHPLRTLGLAAAAGLVVGYLSSR